MYRRFRCYDPSPLPRHRHPTLLFEHAVLLPHVYIFFLHPSSLRQGTTLVAVAKGYGKGDRLRPNKDIEIGFGGSSPNGHGGPCSGKSPETPGSAFNLFLGGGDRGGSAGGPAEGDGGGSGQHARNTALRGVAASASPVRSFLWDTVGLVCSLSSNRFGGGSFFFCQAGDSLVIYVTTGCKGLRERWF